MNHLIIKYKVKISLGADKPDLIILEILFSFIERFYKVAKLVQNTWDCFRTIVILSFMCQVLGYIF